MLRCSAAAEFASHCIPKAVVLMVRAHPRVWTETTSLPCARVCSDLGERPWSTASKSELPGALFQTRNMKQETRNEMPCLGRLLFLVSCFWFLVSCFWFLVSGFHQNACVVAIENTRPRLPRGLPLKAQATSARIIVDSKRDTAKRSPAPASVLNWRNAALPLSTKSAAPGSTMFSHSRPRKTRRRRFSWPNWRRTLACPTAC